MSEIQPQIRQGLNLADDIVVPSLPNEPTPQPAQHADPIDREFATQHQVNLLEEDLNLKPAPVAPQPQQPVPQPQQANEDAEYDNATQQLVEERVIQNRRAQVTNEIGNQFLRKHAADFVDNPVNLMLLMEQLNYANLPLTVPNLDMALNSVRSISIRAVQMNSRLQRFDASPLTFRFHHPRLKRSRLLHHAATSSHRTKHQAAQSIAPATGQPLRLTRFPTRL